jgi:uncharacterized protein YneF (UPF0154 family)
MFHLSLLHILHHLNYVPVIVISIIGFVFGGLWYSRILFAKAWMREVNFTEEQCKAQGGGGKKLFLTFLCTLAATITLDVLIGMRGSVTATSGAKLGLLVGIGLVAALQGPAALFEGRSCRYCWIVLGHNVALCVLLGAILGVWR